MTYVYAILGAGRQGTAAAYDLALRGEASEIRLIDSDLGCATRAAERLLRLLGAASGAPPPPAVRPVRRDITDAKGLVAALAGAHAALSAVPYRFNLEAARAAIAAGCHFNDLGGNTDVVRQELALDREARAAGVSIVPDCGLAPGMSQTLAVYAMSKIERPRHVRIRCGGLPQVPRPPLDYQLVFNVAGLTNEYTGTAVCLRNGAITKVPAFTEPEPIEFPPPVGKCEAFITSGGTSTAPWTFNGKLETYEYKTVRYKGHYDRVRALIDLGFLGIEPVSVDGRSVVPRELTHLLLEKHLLFPGDPDLVVLRVECSGEGRDRASRPPIAEERAARRDAAHGPGATRGRRSEGVPTDGPPAPPEGSIPVAYRIDLLDFQDPATGFTAMERTTAFPAAIVTYLQASGTLGPGAAPLETAVPADRFVQLLDRRGFKIVHAGI